MSKNTFDSFADVQYDQKPYDETIQEMVKEVEQAEIAAKDNTVTLTNGVVLTTRRIAPLRLESIYSRFKYDDPPQVKDENGRMIPNPDHPAYLAHKKDVDERQGLAMIDAIIVFGTEFRSAPEDVDTPESSRWVDECKFMGIPVDTSSLLATYLSWVKYVAIVDNKDIESIIRKVVSNLGVSEENIAKAMDSFRSNEVRQTNPQDSTEEVS